VGMRPASVVSVLVDKKEEANSIHTNTTAAGSFQLTGTFVMFSNTIVLFPLPLSSLDSFPYVTAHILIATSVTKTQEIPHKAIVNRHKERRVKKRMESCPGGRS
jgi:hypothetical protein